jgi:hypothetical protein
MAIGIAIAALRWQSSNRAARVPPDTVDAFATIYLLVATVYLLLPELFPHVLGGEATNVRLNAWRLDCLFVVLFLAARRLPFSAAQLRRAVGVVLIVGGIMLIFGIWETVNSISYQHLIVRTIGLPRYQYNILHSLPPTGQNYVTRASLGGLSVVRAGSLSPDAIPLGFYMVIPLALGIEQLGNARPRTGVILGTAAAGVMLVLTETRSAILGGVIAIALSVHLAFRRQAAARMRLVLLTVGAALLIIPLTAHSDLRTRFDSIFNHTSSVDNQAHITRTQSALHQVLDQPAGKGLGANPTTGVRYSTGNLTISENSYLQVGSELGWAGMAAFVLMYLALLRKAVSVARKRSVGSSLSGGIWLAGAGLFVGGFFLQVWTSLPVSLTYWGLAGAAFGADAYRRSDANQQDRSLTAAEPELFATASHF